MHEPVKPAYSDRKTGGRFRGIGADEQASMTGVAAGHLPVMFR
jgi:hypothetical protein